jgi:signal peptidase
VYPSKIIGKWTGSRMPVLGRLMKFLKTKTGFLVCILIPMAIFFLFELFKLIMVVIQMRQGDKTPELDEEEIKKRAIEEYLAEQQKLKENQPQQDPPQQTQQQTSTDNAE